MEKYHGTLQDEKGNIITTASIQVFLANTGTPAALKDDDEVTALDNPFTVASSNYESSGNYYFKAVNGVYDIRITNGSSVSWIYDVSLYDADDYTYVMHDTVALMKLDSLTAGITVKTRGYYTAGDGGGAEYLIVAPQAFDGYGDHELANLNVAVLQRNGVIYGECFGAKFDETTDDSAALQAAVDLLNAADGGIIDLPPKMAVASIILKSKVILRGQHRGVQTFSYVPSTRLKAPVAGGDAISGGTVNGGGIMGIQFIGRGAATASKGINITSANKVIFSDLNFNDFADEGLLVSGGVASEFTHVFAQNCLLDTTRAAKTGVFDVDGTDHWISTMEVTASVGALTDANAYCGAIVIKGSNHFCHSLVGETSDFGIRFEATNSRLSICRSDLNLGNGWEITGSNNKFIGCDSLSNGSETVNTYDGWYITGNSNKFNSCTAGNPSNQHRYGFNDTLNSDLNKNTYTDSSSTGHGTKAFNTNAFAGSAVLFMSGPPKLFAGADTTPSVDQYCTFKTGGVDAYTFFDDGVNGQTIKILANHAGSFVFSANLRTNTGANKTLVVYKTYTFTLFNGTWYEDE